jgi:hypothetical protein
MKKVKKMFGGGGLPTADRLKAMSDKRRSAPGYTPGTAGLGDMPLEKLRQMQAENAPKIATRPTPTTGGSIQGVKPTVTGAPDKNLPFVINNKPILGMRPPGTATTGGPKPAPGNIGLGAIANNPRMTRNLGGLGGSIGGASFGLGGAPLPPGMKGPGSPPPLDISKTAGPGALDMTKTAGPGFGPSAPFNQAKMNQINSMLYGKPMKKGGAVKTKKMASGGKVSSASKRGDGCAIKGKTKGKMV